MSRSPSMNAPSRSITGRAINYPEYYQCDRAEMLPFVPQSVSRVLEVGCGAGRFGAEIRRSRKAEVWGIEAIPEIAAQAAERLDRVLTKNIEDGALELPSDYFDCIIFNDVLEHLTYP